jgi:hypothetical protein
MFLIAVWTEFIVYRKLRAAADECTAQKEMLLL